MRELRPCFGQLRFERVDALEQEDRQSQGAGVEFEVIAHAQPPRSAAL